MEATCSAAVEVKDEVQMRISVLGEKIFSYIKTIWTVFVDSVMCLLTLGRCITVNIFPNTSNPTYIIILTPT